MGKYELTIHLNKILASKINILLCILLNVSLQSIEKIAKDPDVIIKTRDSALYIK